jgi:hypothetical protein
MARFVRMTEIMELNAGLLTAPPLALRLPEEEADHRCSDQSRQNADRKFCTNDRSRDVIQSENEQATQQRSRRKQASMVRTDEHPGAMRHYQPHSADDSTDRNLRRNNQ